MADFDLAVIGGGIHGAGVARDAAGRGLKVVLIEQNDLASGTSSASTKLAHGGLRYLEQGALRLVYESLAEREVLLRIAPHLVRPMRFILPAPSGRRAAWKLGLGLRLYDLLAGWGSLPFSRRLDLGTDPAGDPLLQRQQAAFEYSDCAMDDARLVVLNALDAAERGATIRTRTCCIRAERAEVWTLVTTTRGRRSVVTARALVNAAGPWMPQLLRDVVRAPAKAALRLVKGSHIVVRRLFEHERAYILQNSDRRIVFAIPYQRDFTLVGTTDIDFTGDPAAPKPTGSEIDYLCAAVNGYFRKQVSASDVIWSFSGVRLLHDDHGKHAQDVGRDYVLDFTAAPGHAPLLSIEGGKLTTYRRVAEAAVDKFAGLFALKPRWTSRAPLPGGDIADGLPAFAARLRRDWPFLDDAHVQRLATAYGTRAARILHGVRSLADLGPRFGGDLTAAEVRYLMRFEWAETPDDVLWRRSKLGLRVTPDDRQRLGQFMASAMGAD